MFDQGKLVQNLHMSCLYSLFEDLLIVRLEENSFLVDAFVVDTHGVGFVGIGHRLHNIARQRERAVGTDILSQQQGISNMWMRLIQCIGREFYTLMLSQQGTHSKQNCLT